MRKQKTRRTLTKEKGARPVQPGAVEPGGPRDALVAERLEKSMIAIAIESWRFCRVFARVVNKLDVGESSRYVSQLRYFQKKIDEALSDSGMKLVNIEGQPHDPGMAAAALNIADFAPDDVLVVDQMVEPIIMGKDGLKRVGTVMLRKVAT